MMLLSCTVKLQLHQASSRDSAHQLTMRALRTQHLQSRARDGPARTAGHIVSVCTRHNRCCASAHTQPQLEPEGTAHSAALARRSLLLLSAAPLLLGAPQGASAEADGAVATQTATQAPAEASTSTSSQSRVQSVSARIEDDFVKRQYYVTGDLSRDLYEPNCRFVDPTTDVTGVERYSQAVSLLFDPSQSKAELISIQVTSPTEVQLKWRLEGALRIGGLKIKPYTGTTLYTLDPKTGLIVSHSETWDISTLDAFVSTVLPGFGAPPAPSIEELRRRG